MEEEFKIIMNMNDEMFDIFQKSLEKEEYEIVEKKEKILFIKKSKNVLTDKQKSIILSIARKQNVERMLVWDITSAVQYLMKTPEEKIKNDGRFSWMMRQSFLKAIIKSSEINGSEQNTNNLSNEEVEKIKK